VAALVTSAGSLSQRLRFFQRATGDDGAGNQRGVWVEQFALWAEMKSRPGSESYAAARFEGKIPYQVRVRWSPDAMRIGTDWMARDQYGRSYNVQAPQPDLVRRQWVDMILVAGADLG
jgi:SPP1 family predicted phage head-tail adaptor